MSTGTYVAYRVLNHKELRDWCYRHGLTVTEEELHVTVAFSRKAFEPKLDKTSIIAINPLFCKGYNHFGEVLALEIDHPQLQALFRDCMERGATYDYSSYRPHITLAKLEDIDGEVDIPEPKFHILLGKVYVEELELDDH